MGKDIFSSVSNGREYQVGSRRPYTLPVSILLHVLAVAAIFIVPLVTLDAVSGLPGVRVAMGNFVIAMPAPPPPPVTIRTPPPPTPTPDPIPDKGESIPVDSPNPEKPDGNKGVFDPRLPVIEGGDDFITKTGRLTLPSPPPPVKIPEIVRVGQGGLITAPVKTKNFLPVYPTVARFAKVEGMVELQVIIDKDGKIRDAKVTRSVTLLDQAALDAVRLWEYQPTKLNGQPVAVLLTVTVNFSLR